MERIDRQQARTLIVERGAQLQIVDVRDEQSFQQGHMEGAVHLGGNGLQDFIQEADPEQPLLVYCYHGHMSLSAAAYFEEQGFGEVYSLDGGFEDWQQG